MAEGNKLNSKLLEDYLASSTRALSARANLEEAERQLETELVELGLYSDAVKADRDLLKVLCDTGVRTLNDKVLYLDIDGELSIKEFVQTPCLWELK